MLLCFLLELGGSGYDDDDAIDDEVDCDQEKKSFLVSSMANSKKGRDRHG